MKRGNLRADRISLINSLWTESNALCRKCKRLAIGDQCTKLFFFFVKSKRLMTFVNRLDTNKGCVEGRENVTQHMIQFFYNILGVDSPYGRRCPEKAFQFAGTLRIEQHVRLCKPFRLRM